MDRLHTDEHRRARADARKLLALRRRHIRIIRKRAIVGSVSAFAAAWAAIGFQLVTGHDPALSKSTKAAVVAPTSVGVSKKSSTSSASSSSSSEKRSRATSSSSSSQPLAPVTTQQS